MILELKENEILVDNDPKIKNVILNLDPRRRLIRVKFHYIGESKGEDIDLALAYDNPKVSLCPPSIKFNIIGKELLRDISFQEDLIYNLLERSFRVIVYSGGVKSKFDFNNLCDIPKHIVEVIKFSNKV